MKNIALAILFCFPGSHLLQAQNTYTPTDAGSKVRFVIKNFGLKTDGRFKGLKGTIHFNPANPGVSDFAVSVDAATINTGIGKRDRDLKKAKYFDVAHHPRLYFKSTMITAIADGRFNMVGNLTIKGITKPVQFGFTATPKEGGYLFEGSFEVNRRDYKVGSGSMSLQDNVKVNLSVLAKK